MRAKIRDIPAQAWAGSGLLAIGVALTVAIAVLGSSSKPASASTQALLTLMAALAQVGAALTFARIGRADPTLARSAVSRLIRLARRAIEGRQLADGLAVHDAVPAELRAAAGRLSVHLSYLEEGFVESVEDWRSFHPATVKNVEKGLSRDDE